MVTLKAARTQAIAALVAQTVYLQVPVNRIKEGSEGQSKVSSPPFLRVFVFPDSITTLESGRNYKQGILAVACGVKAASDGFKAEDEANELAERVEKVLFEAMGERVIVAQEGAIDYVGKSSNACVSSIAFQIKYKSSTEL